MCLLEKMGSCGHDFTPFHWTSRRGWCFISKFIAFTSMTLCLYSVTYFGLTILFFSLLLRILNKGILFGTHLVTILQLLDAISRVACLGFEKSYRESIVLMTRSYLDKVKALGASENNTVPSEATTERTEVCDEFCKKIDSICLSYEVWFWLLFNAPC